MPGPTDALVRSVLRTGARGAARSASARTLVPITSSRPRTGPYGVRSGGIHWFSLRTSISHCSPVSVLAAIRRADSGSMLMMLTCQPRSSRPCTRSSVMADMGAGFSVATSMSWLSRSTSPCAWHPVPAGDHQRVRGAAREDVGQEPAVQCGDVHAAVDARCASSGNAASQASRTCLLIMVLIKGHCASSRSRFRKRVMSSRCPSASTVR